MDVRHSRALRLADEIGAGSEETLLGRLEGSRVVVAVGDDELSVLTAEVLVDTLRRLPIHLALEPTLGSAAFARIFGVARMIDPNRAIEVGHASSGDVLVAVGCDRPEAIVAGVPVRHGALIVSGEQLESSVAEASGLGVFTCAALLAGEVFKRVAAVRTERATFPDRLAWCPVMLNDEPWATPLLGAPSRIDLALIGLGAIGTATCRILALLGTEGLIQLVDPERFGPENLGTYSLGTAQDVAREPWKVELAAAALHSMAVKTHVGTAAHFIEKVDSGNAPWPALVLTGLDSAASRREVQRLWPDRMIDGATGDTMCGLHDVLHGSTPCLMCLFPERREGPGAAERLAEATGLALSVVSHGDRPLESRDIDHLDADRRQVLEPHLGEPVCGLAEAVGLTELAAGAYRPSVPFVSQQAGCMVVGRLIADLLGTPRSSANFVQYDALVGPGAATLEERRPVADCYCQHRADIVESVRELRRA